MRFLYCLSGILILIEVCRRRFDFVSFGAVTYVAYTINCALGTTWITGGKSGYYYYAQIGTETYLLVLMQLLMIYLFLFCERHGIFFRFGTQIVIKNPMKDTEGYDAKLKTYWKVLFVFSCFAFYYAFFIDMGMDQVLSYTRKTVIVQNTSTLFALGMWAAMVSFIYSVKQSDKKRMILSGILILLTVFLGTRAYFASVVVGLIALRRGKMKNLFNENFKFFLGGGIIAFMLMAYKVVYRSVRALDFTKALEELRTGKIITSIFDIAEFRNIFSIYNYVVTEHFHLPFSDTMARVLSLIPYLNNYLKTTYPIRLATIAKNIFFESSYGLGSSFWAESFAMGGVALLILATIGWLLFLRYASKMIDLDSDSSIFVVSVAAYCSFYIHRLDWVQVLGCIKSILLFYLLWYVFKQIKRIQAP